MLSSLNSLSSKFLASPARRYFYAISKGLALSLTLVFIAQGKLSFLAFFAWLGLIPVILLSKSAKSYSQLLLESLVFFLSYYLVAFHWLFSLHPLTWQGFNNSESIIISLLAWFSVAVFHSFLASLFAIASKSLIDLKNKRERNANNYSVLDITLLSFFWCVIQYKLPNFLGELGVFNVPLHLLAYSQSQFSALIQVCNIIGAIGLEFLIVFTNLSLSNLLNVRAISPGNIQTSNSQILRTYFKTEGLNKTLVLFLSLIAVISAGYFYGKAVLTENLEVSDKKYLIASASFTAKDSRGNKLRPELSISKLKEASKLTDYEQKLDMLVWPEGAVPQLLGQKAPLELDELKEFTELLIFGTYHKKSAAVYNSIAFYDFNEVKYYNKQNLVPFGEYTPFTAWLPNQLKELAISAIGTGFERGSPHQKPIQTPIGAISSNVCFEILFPEFVRKEFNKGADLIININDLSWFHSKALRTAFITAAKFRAIENRSPILLASNVGQSLLINPHGTISKDLEFSKKGSLYSQYFW